MTVVNVASLRWHITESYGRLTLELVHHLERLGVQVNRLGAAGVIHQERPACGGFLISIPTAFPTFDPSVQHGTRVALTMFETTCIPQAWVQVLNTCAAVIVPAAFCVDSFRNSGVTVPIHGVPLGISDGFKQPRKRAHTRPFTVLAIGDRGRRKNWLDAIRMFNKAFGNSSRHRLIIKSLGLPLRISNPNVQVIEADYSEADMLALYQRAHVMLFPSRGEGFGFPPREFAATGGVALATDWSGTADDLKHWGLPLRYTGFEPGYTGTQDHWQSGAWVVPDIQHAAQVLRQVERNYSQYANFALDAADYVARRYQWQQFADHCWDIYQYYKERSHERLAS